MDAGKTKQTQFVVLFSVRLRYNCLRQWQTNKFFCDDETFFYWVNVALFSILFSVFFEYEDVPGEEEISSLLNSTSFFAMRFCIVRGFQTNLQEFYSTLAWRNPNSLFCCMEFSSHRYRLYITSCFISILSFIDISFSVAFFLFLWDLSYT